MATLEQLIDGLRKADAAGNADDARAFAGAIRQMQAEPPRETTAEEGLARGAAPYAMSMGAGALVGGGLGALVGGPIGAVGGAALGARLAPAGLAAADAGTQLYNVFANRFGGRAVPTPANTLADIAGSVGVGRPGAPVAEAIGGGAASAGTVAAGLRGLGGYVADPVRRGVLNAMAAQPGLQSVAGGAGAGTAAALGEYAGVTDPLSLTLASIAAGGVTAPVAAAAGNLGVRGGNALVRQFGLRLDPAEAYRAEIAGGRGPQIVEALRGTPVSETGAPLTAAQASVGAEAPAYTAAMRDVAGAMPDTAAQQFQMLQAQRAARAQTLAQEAGTPAQREAMVERRAEITDPMYQAAKSAANVADIAPAYDTVQSLMQSNPGNRPLMRELRAISRNLVETDELGEAALRTNAQQISSVIDDLKTSINKQDNKFIKGQLTQVRDELIAGVPGYGEAQAAFRTASTPLNQRYGMQFLKEKLEAPLLDEGERPGAFGAAVKALTSERDAPAALRRLVDNMPRYRSLEELYSPDQLTAIDKVRLDLSRDAKLRELVTAGRSSAGDPSKVATRSGMGEGTPPTLNPLMALANRILKRNAGRLDEKLAMELALESLNPQVAAAALERSLARQAQLAKFQVTPPSMMQRGAFAASQLPAVVNVMGQQNQNAMAR
jgi:hypothetical protein